MASVGSMGCKKKFATKDTQIINQELWALLNEEQTVPKVNINFLYHRANLSVFDFNILQKPTVPTAFLYNVFSVAF